MLASVNVSVFASVPFQNIIVGQLILPLSGDNDLFVGIFTKVRLQVF